MIDRYHRQTLLPHIGLAGQERLGRSRVLLVGCGALGTVLAETLVRAGVGFCRVVDRDIVELTNLQRQVLFDERDAAEQTPKAIAAYRRLRQINSEVAIEPVVADVHSGNIEELAGLTAGGDRVDIICDGTDNADTRYLINDVAVKHNVPWVYGACVGMAGRAMAIEPGRTPCLRCLFPEPPAPGELPTCDTTGVFSPVAAMVAAVQSSQTLKLLCRAAPGASRDSESGASFDSTPEPSLFVLDLTANVARFIPAGQSRIADCIACGQRRFEFLTRPSTGAVTLCGRGAIQVRPPTPSVRLDLNEMAERLRGSGAVEQTPYLLRCHLREESLSLTLFPDARLIVHGLTDVERGRSLYARYVGG